MHSGETVKNPDTFPDKLRSDYEYLIEEKNFFDRPGNLSFDSWILQNGTLGGGGGGGGGGVFEVLFCNTFSAVIASGASAGGGGSTSGNPGTIGGSSVNFYQPACGN